jgi:adenine-specific DNA-methyltransferase
VSISPQDKLRSLLRELFQFDSADLDFGIYRIMNMKREAIEQFIENGLIEAVSKELHKGTLGEQAHAADDLEKLAVQVKQALDEDAIDENGNLSTQYHTTALGKKYLAAQSKATGAKSSSGLEAVIYNHLFAFFSRYYDQGDFISKRRYSRREKYAIPYNGEEVYLHWANSDQYYVKSSQYFTDYSYKAPNGVTVSFKLRRADVEKDNVKGDVRYFIPISSAATFDAKGKSLLLPFEYRPLTSDEAKQYPKTPQPSLLSDATRDLTQKLASIAEALLAMSKEHHKGSKGESVSYLEHHLKQYTRRNTSDYFVHKDLKGFLARELDFYIKNEVLSLDDFTAGDDKLALGWLQTSKVVRAVAHTVIEFLAQIEDFQKLLFEKQKFVTRSQYFVRVDVLTSEAQKAVAANDQQWASWLELFNLKGLGAKEKASVPERLAFMQKHPSLYVDSRCFDYDEFLAMLNGLGNLDEATDGLLINADNFQALRYLGKTYEQGVDAIYIDPPYNSDASEILYKTDYKDSSWLTLMDSRLRLSNGLMEADSPISIAIDDYGLANLTKLMERVLPGYDIHRVVVNHYPGSGTGRSNVTRTHEYALFGIPQDKAVLRGDELPSGTRTRPFRRAGTGNNNYRTGRWKSFYAVLVNKKTLEVMGLEAPPELGVADYPKGDTKEGWARVYPIGEDGSERVWSLSYESKDYALEKGRLQCTPKMSIERVFTDDKRRALLQSVWLDKKFNATTFGTNLLTNILGSSGLFSYPKSVHTVETAVEAMTCDNLDAVVLDYFGGSGTTAHAVIKLNQRDEGSRRFILVDFAEYFEQVLLPRVLRVAFAPEWKDGSASRLPTSKEVARSPRVIKVIGLESYEDALGNIKLVQDAAPELEFGDYILHYMLHKDSKGAETLLNVKSLQNPFGYTLVIYEQGGNVERSVDIPETFSALLGMSVSSIRVYKDGSRRYLVYRGAVAGRVAVVIWRSTESWKQKDFEQDKAFVAKQGITEGADEVFVNCDSLIPKAKVLDPIFKARMFGDN